MKSISNIIYTTIVVLLIGMTVACKPDGDTGGKFSLSCGDKLTLIEGETEIASVQGVEQFVVYTDNDCVAWVVNDNNTIAITAVKVGSCVLTVTRNDGEQLSCAITVTKSAAQKDFEIISTPRVENWLPQTVNTETTAGLQVTFESGIDAAGRKIEGMSTYGFYFTETGAFCRISARGNFTSRGIQSDGMVAMFTPGEPICYYLCDKVDVVNILNGKVWIVASMPQHPDLRVVTETF